MKLRYAIQLSALGLFSLSLSSCAFYSKLRGKGEEEKVTEKVEEKSETKVKKNVVAKSEVELPEVTPPKEHPGNISGITFSAPDVSKELPTSRDTQTSEVVKEEVEKTLLATPEAPVE